MGNFISRRNIKHKDEMQNVKRERSREGVWGMFDDIALKYDFLNHVLSFGLDVLWRKKLSKHIRFSENMTILDLCSGTGDQAFSILNRGKFDGGKIIAMDMSERMLDLCGAKTEKRGFGDIVSLLRGNAEELPFNENSIDTVNISFGLRNIGDISKCLSEVYRVLKPSGQLLVLEFSMPRNRFIRFFYGLYLSTVLPLFGRWLSGNEYAYAYLSDTIRTFPSGQSVLTLFRNSGFRRTAMIELCLDTVTLYMAEK